MIFASALRAIRVSARAFVRAPALPELVLSVLGLFSAQSDAARERRREMALRIALGAQRWRVVLDVMTSAIRIGLMGTAMGALVSVACLRVLGSKSSLLSSPPVFVWMLVALLPTATVFVASVFPAMRASRVDPMTIVRDEV